MKMTIGAVVMPGTSRSNDTGSWRTGKIPKFLQENCTGCSLCALLCPEGIVFGDKKNTYHADYEYCKGCGICATECPANDIVMVPEVK